MPYAKQEDHAKYQKEHYTVLGLKMAPEDADLIRAAATEAGQSYSQYVLQAVRERIAREKGTE